MAKKTEKKETDGKWYRIRRDDDFSFSLLERDGDEIKTVHTDIIGIVMPMCEEALQREAGVL